MTWAAFVSHCSMQDVTNCAGHCMMQDVTNCAGHSMMQDVTYCAGHCLMQDVTNCAAHCSMQCVTNCAGHCVMQDVADCAGHCLMQDVTDCAGHCSMQCVTNCAGHCLMQDVTNCVGHCLMQCVTNGAGHCLMQDVTNCVGHCLMQDVTRNLVTQHADPWLMLRLFAQNVASAAGERLAGLRRGRCENLTCCSTSDTDGFLSDMKPYSRCWLQTGEYTLNCEPAQLSNETTSSQSLTQTSHETTSSHGLTQPSYETTSSQKFYQYKLNSPKHKWSVYGQDIILLRNPQKSVDGRRRLKPRWRASYDEDMAAVRLLVTKIEVGQPPWLNLLETQAELNDETQNSACIHAIDKDGENKMSIAVLKKYSRMCCRRTSENARASIPCNLPTLQSYKGGFITFHTKFTGHKFVTQIFANVTSHKRLSHKCPDQKRPSHKRPNQKRPSHKRPDQKRPSHKRPDQKRPCYKSPNQKGPDQKHPNQKLACYKRPDHEDLVLLFKVVPCRSLQPCRTTSCFWDRRYLSRRQSKRHEPVYENNFEYRQFCLLNVNSNAGISENCSDGTKQEIKQPSCTSVHSTDQYFSTHTDIQDSKVNDSDMEVSPSLCSINDGADIVSISYNDTGPVPVNDRTSHSPLDVAEKAHTLESAGDARHKRYAENTVYARQSDRYELRNHKCSHGTTQEATTQLKPKRRTKTTETLYIKFESSMSKKVTTTTVLKDGRKLSAITKPPRFNTSKQTEAGSDAVNMKENPRLTKIVRCNDGHTEKVSDNSFRAHLDPAATDRCPVKTKQTVYLAELRCTSSVKPSCVVGEAIKSDITRDNGVLERGSSHRSPVRCHSPTNSLDVRLDVVDSDYASEKESSVATIVDVHKRSKVSQHPTDKIERLKPDTTRRDTNNKDKRQQLRQVFSLKKQRPSSLPDRRYGHNVRADSMSSSRSHSDAMVPAMSDAHHVTQANSNVGHLALADSMASTGSHADSVTSLKTALVISVKSNADSISKARSNADPVTPTWSHADPVTPTRSHADSITPTRSHANPVTSTRSHANPVTPTKSHTDPVTSTRSHADPVTPTRSHTDPVTSTRSHTDPVTSTRCHADSITSTRCHADPVTPTRSHADPVTPTRSHADPVTPTRSHADPVTSTKSHADPVTSTKSPADPVTSTKGHADPVTLTRSHADPVTPTRSHADPVTPTKSHADPVTLTRSHADPVTSTKSNADPVTSTRSHAEPVTSTRSHAEPVTSTRSHAEPVTSTKNQSSRSDQSIKNEVTFRRKNEAINKLRPRKRNSHELIKSENKKTSTSKKAMRTTDDKKEENEAGRRLGNKRMCRKTSVQSVEAKSKGAQSKRRSESKGSNSPDSIKSDKAKKSKVGEKDKEKKKKRKKLKVFGKNFNAQTKREKSHATRKPTGMNVGRSLELSKTTQTMPCSTSAPQFLQVTLLDAPLPTVTYRRSPPPTRARAVDANIDRDAIQSFDRNVRKEGTRQLKMAERATSSAENVSVYDVCDKCVRSTESVPSFAGTVYATLTKVVHVSTCPKSRKSDRDLQQAELGWNRNVLNEDDKTMAENNKSFKTERARYFLVKSRMRANSLEAASSKLKPLATCRRALTDRDSSSACQVSGQAESGQQKTIVAKSVQFSVSPRDSELSPGDSNKVKVQESVDVARETIANQSIIEATDAQDTAAHDGKVEECSKFNPSQQPVGDQPSTGSKTLANQKEECHKQTTPPRKIRPIWQKKTKDKQMAAVSTSRKSLSALVPVQQNGPMGGLLKPSSRFNIQLLYPIKQINSQVLNVHDKRAVAYNSWVNSTLVVTPMNRATRKLVAKTGSPVDIKEIIEGSPVDADNYLLTLKSMQELALRTGKSVTYLTSHRNSDVKLGVRRRYKAIAESHVVDQNKVKERKVKDNSPRSASSLGNACETFTDVKAGHNRLRAGKKQLREVLAEYETDWSDAAARDVESTPDLLHVEYYTDMTEFNTINMGLSWMVQSVFNRLTQRESQANASGDTQQV